eukprot:m.713369 g.713369  ORF g.713369 m.713369 type:complete len:348 (+) comp58781_c0_seq16:2079-3122(+)
MRVLSPHKQHKVLVQLHAACGKIHNRRLAAGGRLHADCVTGTADGCDGVGHVHTRSQLQPVQHPPHVAAPDRIALCPRRVPRRNKRRQEVSHILSLDLQVRHHRDGDGCCLPWQQVAHAQLEDVSALLLQQLSAIATGHSGLVGGPRLLLLAHLALGHHPVNVGLEGADGGALVQRKHIHSLDRERPVVVELLRDGCARAEVDHLHLHADALQRHLGDHVLVHPHQPVHALVGWQQHLYLRQSTVQEVFVECCLLLWLVGVVVSALLVKPGPSESTRVPRWLAQMVSSRREPAGLASGRRREVGQAHSSAKGDVIRSTFHFSRTLTEPPTQERSSAVLTRASFHLVQ